MLHHLTNDDVPLGYKPHIPRHQHSHAYATRLTLPKISPAVCCSYVLQEERDHCDLPQLVKENRDTFKHDYNAS